VRVSDALLERSKEDPPRRLGVWSLSPGESATARAIATLKALLPLRRADFERRLVRAMKEAARGEGGFFLPAFSARRALGADLIVEVKPLSIRKRLYHRLPDAKRVYLQDRFLGCGSWRPLLQPLAASSTHRDVQEIIAAGFDYRRTDAYQHAMTRLRGPHPIRRNFVALKSPELVEGYFRQLADLCLSIRDNGVRRREQIRSTAGLFKNPTVRLPWVEFMESDIGLAVGPEGEIFHFASGKHRTAASQALRLATVPAEVRVVHLVWLQRQIKDTGLPPVDALLAGIRSLDIGTSGDAMRDAMLDRNVQA
jgi:hypothetical protein